jgi:hypothetical protein
MLTPSPETTEESTKNPCELYVAQDAIAVDGVAPEVGEEIELTAKFKVVRNEEGKVCLAPTSVNGSPVIDEEAGPGEPDSDDDMMAMAKKADEANGSGLNY